MSEVTEPQNDQERQCLMQAAVAEATAMMDKIIQKQEGQRIPADHMGESLRPMDTVKVQPAQPEQVLALKVQYKEAYAAYLAAAAKVLTIRKMEIREQLYTALGIVSRDASQQ